MNRTHALPKSFWWLGGSLVPMVIGAFGPWAKVLDLATINGTDGGRDGWLVVGAAGITAIALFAFARFRRGWLLALPLIAGLASVAATAYDLSDITGAASAEGLLASVVEPAWGIYVALGASVSLVLASIGSIAERRHNNPMPRQAPSGA